jgi:hypothetical protein
MFRSKFAVGAAAAMGFASMVGTAQSETGGMARLQLTPWIKAAAASCKQVSSCEEAVELWCGGYRRADGDGDGVPCENVCSSVEEVDRIRVKIGC